MKKYDNTKNYQWMTTDVFEFQGNEFQAVLNIIKDELNKPESQKIIGMYNFYLQVLEKKLEDGINKGFVIEKPNEEGSD